MHENFISLEREKRDRIINAAIREFTDKGFKNASTNEIVKNAGISKGALFHYFPSKQDLFAFLFHYSVDLFIEASAPRIKEMPPDVFERWILFSALKIEIATQYPDMADFMQRVYRDDTHQGEALIKAEYKRFAESFQSKIYSGIDLTKFKHDIDVNAALQIIWWVLEGFSLSKSKDLSHLPLKKPEEFLMTLTAEIRVYLDMLKKSFYKDEFSV